MSRPSPSGGGDNSSRPLLSQPLSFQTLIDRVPQPYRPNIFNEPPYSYLRDINVSQMVDVSDSSDSESGTNSGAERQAGSSAAAAETAEPSAAAGVAESSQEEEEVRVPEGTWSYDEVESRLTQADLDQLKLDYLVPDEITFRVPGSDELPSCPPPGEIALNRWFFKCGLRLPIPLFVRRLLRDVRLAPLQLNPNAWKGIYCCFVLWQENFGIDPTPSEIQACFEIRSAANKVGSFCYYPRRRKFLVKPPEVSNWQREWFFVGGDWEDGGEPATPRRFCGNNHKWSPSFPSMDESSRFRVNHILDLELYERDSTILLKEARLAGGSARLLLPDF